MTKTTNTTGSALNQIREALTREVKHQESTIREFAAAVITDLGAGPETDPGYQFGWADGAFKAAGRVTAAKSLLAHANKETATVDSIRDFATSEALRHAEFPSSSTSPTSNFYELQIAAAFADHARRMAAR